MILSLADRLRMIICLHFGELPAQITADYIEVDHRYLPSVEGEFYETELYIPG